jgi:hypothetical protein
LATSTGDPRFVLGLALMALAAGVAVVATARRQPAVAVGAALWLGAILPTQSIVPKLDALTERPLELGLAGIVLALLPAVGWLASRGRARRWGTAGVATAIVVGLAAATLTRGPRYRSDLALWSDAAEKSQTHARPHYNYGIALELAGDRSAALAEMRRADALDHFDPDVAHALTRLTHPSREEEP